MKANTTAPISKNLHPYPYSLPSLLQKIVSIFFITWGFSSILKEIYELFFIFPKVPQSFLINHSYSTLQVQLLKEAVSLFISNFVATIYGIFLISKRTYQLKIFHYALGIVVLILMAFINTINPNPDLKSLISILGGSLIQ